MEKMEYGSDLDVKEAAGLFAELPEADQYAILQALRDVMESR